MLNRMYKIIILTVVSILTILCLASCGTFKCDMCGKEKTGKSYSASDMTICDDCYSSMSSLID